MSDTEEDKPLDPVMERLRVKMMRLLVVSIGIMLIGLMAVLAAIVYKVGKKPAGMNTAQGAAAVPVEAGFEGRIELPQGAEIVASALDGDHVLLHLRLAGGDRQVVIYSLSGNRIIARIAVE